MAHLVHSIQLLMPSLPINQTQATFTHHQPAESTQTLRLDDALHLANPINTWRQPHRQNVKSAELCEWLN